MKILFICGSLEPGKDGVGDYTRRLAEALIKNGYSCFIVALMDNFVLKPEENEEMIEAQTICIWRLPNASGYFRNSKVARQLVKTIHPDLISIQYVPHAYHPKGLPLGLSVALDKVCSTYPVHIMFHELWLGMHSNASKIHKIIGFIEQQIAKSIIKKLNPLLVTTSNALYNFALHKKGIKSQILPLFSNISKFTVSNAERLSILDKIGITEALRSNFILVIIFGTLYPNTNFESTLLSLAKAAHIEHKRLKLISIGNIGLYGKNEFERLSKQHSNLMDFSLVGKVDEKLASFYLQCVDMAISCTPYQHIGKSGVYAFLRLHNLQIVLLENSEVIPSYHIVKDWYKQLKSNDSSEWDVGYVAKKFIQMLEA